MAGKYYCDKCGTEIQVKAHRVSISETKTTYGDKNISSIKDLCDGCHTSVKTYIETIVEPKP